MSTVYRNWPLRFLLDKRFANLVKILTSIQTKMVKTRIALELYTEISITQML